MLRDHWFMSVDVPAYREHHLHEMLSIFLDAMEVFRNDLALRTGGKVGWW